MADSGGTLDGLLRELATLVSPLGPSFDTGRAITLVEALGITATPAQAATLAGSLATIGNGVAALGSISEEIRTAIAAEDWGKVLDKGIKAISKLASVIDAFATFATAVGHLPGVTAATVSKLPGKLFEHLLATYFGRTTFLNEALELLGILERADFNVESTDPATPFYTTYTFHFGRVGTWLSKPADILAELYDWGKPSFNGAKLFSAIDLVVASLGLPVIHTTSPPKLDLVVATLELQSGAKPGVLVTLGADVAKTKVELTGDGWTLTADLGFELLTGTEIAITPSAITLKPPDATHATGSASVTFAFQRPDPIILLGVAGGSRVDVASIGATLGFELTWKSDHAEAALDIGAALDGGHVLITTEGSDGFLAKILSGIHLENNFDLGIGFSTASGFFFHGSSALEIELASHVDLGPVELDALTLSLGIKDGKFPVGITTDIKASFGPMQAVVQGIGFALDFALADGTSGNLGPLDLSAEFVPPTGVGLSIDAIAIKGGGYLSLDPDRGEYAGALELDILDLISAKAIGVITTKMPDGSNGFALIIIITAEFSPAFQLGYGFTLNGVGGLVGLNRTVDLDALAMGVKTDSIESVLFPTDVIANAPQIISDLRTLFPPSPDRFIFGPMAKLGWGTPTLISLAFGLIVDIPTGGQDDLKIAILGVLKIALPTDDIDLIKVQINFVGSIDFGKGLLSFDAALYDSHLLFLTLEGSMAVRVKWKDPGAGFLVSIGGFHPSYTPPPELEVLPMDRLAVNILNEDWARIRVEVYFAVTSNTVQTGAKVEIYLGFDAFYVDGYLGFDALFQFSPFYFEIGINAGLTLHVFGLDLLSIRLAFNLSGPSPWHAWGTGSVTILFWDISADFDFSWGDAAKTTLPDVDVLPLLLGDLNDPAHWRALPPPNTRLWVTLRKIDAAAPLVLHPAGKLEVTQKTAPLDLTWERFGNQHPADIDRATLKSATSSTTALVVTPISDNYARSHYQDLSDAEKLSSPSFEQMHTGAVLGFDAAAVGGTGVEREIELETIVIDKEPAPRFMLGTLWALHALQLGGTAKKRAPTSASSRSALDPYPNDKIAVTQESYTVASTVDNKPHGPATTFASHAEARDYMRRQIAGSRGLAGQLHVLPSSEVNHG